MTELAATPRVIEPDAPQYNATLIRRDDQHESLASCTKWCSTWTRVIGDAVPQQHPPGQRRAGQVEPVAHCSAMTASASASVTSRTGTFTVIGAIGS